MPSESDGLLLQGNFVVRKSHLHDLNITINNKATRCTRIQWNILSSY